MQNNRFVINLYRGISKRIKSLFISNGNKAGLNWFKEKFLKHANAGPTRVYHYNKRKIYYVSPAELLHTMKEIFVEEIYKVRLPTDAYIIDCGANIGLGTIYLKEQYPQSEVIAFEPDEKNFSLLVKNIHSFGLENVIARKEAIWVADTILNFSGEGTMGSRIETISSSSGQKVKAVRLKDFLQRKVDLLKMDIEGAEYAVLKDIASELHQVKYLFLEYHGTFQQTDQLTEIFTLLHHAGFHYYIKEAANIYQKPFMAKEMIPKSDYDVQLNIFCLR